MNQTIRKKRIAVVDTNFCVACGCCMNVCPLGAISVQNGITAVVNPQTCVGCGKCSKECPASIITIQEVSS